MNAIPPSIGWVRRLMAFLLATYAIAVFAIMFRAGSPDQFWWWLGMIPFLAWTVAPLATVVFIIRRQTEAASVVVSALLMGLAVVSGIYIYLESMFGEDARSTSALIFLFLPLYQWAIPLLVLVVALIESALMSRQ